MNSTQQIPISHVCSADESESKEFLTEKTLSQVYSTDEGKLESIIVDESSTEKRGSESVHKIINKENDTIY